MKRSSGDRERVNSRARDAQAPGVTRLDRETLESVMCDDVFQAADGKTLSVHLSDVWLGERRKGQRG
jgi:hypothetical protein